MHSRTFAIGDIHGCLDKLEDLLDRIAPGPEDILVFLGDYIDRGDSGKEVVEHLIGLSERISCIFLRGNHEDMFLTFLEFGSNKTLYFANGGLRTVESYIRPAVFTSSDLVARAMPAHHRHFYSRLRWSYENDTHVFVHAGIKPGKPVDDQDRNDLIWIRDEFIFSATGMQKKVIFGHTPFARPLMKPDKIGIDTGAVYGGNLTAIQLPEEKIIQSFR